MKADIAEVFISSDEIASMVKKLAMQINEFYGGEEIVVVGILTGAYVFVADLTRELRMPIMLDFMKVSSYQGDTSTGVLKIEKDLSIDIEGKNVLVVDDVSDTGYTLKTLKNKLMERNPKSVRFCTAFDKKSRRVNDFEPDFFGIDIPDKFIVGYGLDYNNHYRNIKDVRIMKFEGNN